MVVGNLRNLEQAMIMNKEWDVCANEATNMVNLGREHSHRPGGSQDSPNVISL